MPQTTRSNGQKPQRPTSRSRRASTAKPTDAIALLKADHRQVETWFEEFDKTRSDAKKQDLGKKICAALTAHMTIEEEIFYPAFLAATEDGDLHHEAVIEHDGAKKLIAEIQKAGPEDEYFGARVNVLSEMIEHHVKEEEQRDGMFAKARNSEMDLVGLGEQMEQRKRQLLEAPEPADDAGLRGGLVSSAVNALLGRQGSEESRSVRRRS